MSVLGRVWSHFPAITTCSTPRNRGNWKRSYIGTLALLGLTIGSGDFMYFPGLIAKYNGVFLVPYIILMFYVGIPLFAFEMSLGQYLSVGPIKAFGKLAPILTGFGSGMVLISLITSIYYNYYLATTLMLLGRNFYFWTGLGNQTDYGEIASDICSYASVASNSASIPTSEQPFFTELLWCFGFSWIIVGLCLIRGYHTSSELIITTQLIPFFLLAVLVMIFFELEGIMVEDTDIGKLPNAKQSHLFDMLSAEIWYDALRHVSFSLAIGFGAIPTLSSFNKLEHNFIRDSWIVPMANFCTGMMYTLLISRYLPIESDYSYLSVVCVYAKVDSIKPIAGLVYLMFYFMCLSCQLTHVDTGVIAIFDIFNIPTDSKGRFCIVLLIVLLAFALGICICFNYSNYIMLRSFGERIIMTNIILEAFAAPFIFFQFEKIKTQLRLQVSECIENHLQKCWLLITPALIWTIIIWSYVSCGASSPTESALTVILTTFFYLALIGAITVTACWKSEKNIFLSKNFCLYTDQLRPPAVYSVPVFTRIDLPVSLYPMCARRRNTESTLAICQNTESTLSIYQNTESTPTVCQNSESTPTICQNSESTPTACQNSESTPTACQNSESIPAVCQSIISRAEICLNTMLNLTVYQDTVSRSVIQSPQFESTYL